MYQYKSKKGGLRIVYTGQEWEAKLKADKIKKNREIARIQTQTQYNKDFNDRIKLLNECMKSDTHNCKYCN